MVITGKSGGFPSKTGAALEQPPEKAGRSVVEIKRGTSRQLKAGMVD